MEVGSIPWENPPSIAADDASLVSQWPFGGEHEENERPRFIAKETLLDEMEDGIWSAGNQRLPLRPGVRF